jgi:hypothetical protein
MPIDPAQARKINDRAQPGADRLPREHFRS